MLPFDEPPVNIISVEFEKLVLGYLKKIGKGLEDLEITHNQILNGYDGNYQIDIVARFTAFKNKIVVLVECKHHKSKIKRKDVEVLYNRLQSTGSHKGILFATSAFQTGAIDFALRHGIALVQICDSNCHAINFVCGPKDNSTPKEMPKYILEVIYRMPNENVPEIELIIKNFASLRNFVIK
jgi:restriction system protein